MACALDRGRITAFDPGEFVTRRGQNEPRLCIVLSGAVRLTAFTEDGREMLTHFMWPGDCWGVHPVLGNFHETNGTVIERAGEVLILQPAAIDWLMRHRHDFQKVMIAVLCTRLNLAVSLAEQFGAWTARERLAWRLLMLAHALPSKRPQIMQSEIVISQETLASMVHLSRQRTNRLLRVFEDEAILALTYGRIRIVNVDALRTAIDRTR